ncbi:MAG: DUF4286 family protein [Phycisphaerales bacterium]|nr:DUF4286 family protein [Phycisphaerales bacterium]
MIIYNVTSKVSAPMQHDYIQWLKKEHVPDVLKTGCFDHAKIFRLLEVDDAEGPSFVIQYVTGNKANYDRYIAQFANSLRQDAKDKWGHNIVSFRTVMEEL